MLMMRPQGLTTGNGHALTTHTSQTSIGPTIDRWLCVDVISTFMNDECRGLINNDASAVSRPVDCEGAVASEVLRVLLFAGRLAIYPRITLLRVCLSPVLPVRSPV